MAHQSVIEIPNLWWESFTTAKTLHIPRGDEVGLQWPPNRMYEGHPILRSIRSKVLSPIWTGKPWPAWILGCSYYIDLTLVYLWLLIFSEFLIIYAYGCLRKYKRAIFWNEGGSTTENVIQNRLGNYIPSSFVRKRAKKSRFSSINQVFENHVFPWRDIGHFSGLWMESIC